MRRKTIWFLVPLVVLALAAGTAWSQGPGGQRQGPGFGHHGGGMRGLSLLAHPGVQEKLGLTPEQVGQLRGLFFEGARAGIRQRAELQVRRLELEELLQAEEPDRGAIEAKLGELSGAWHGLMAQRVEQRLALREILTPEQRQQIRTLRRQRRHQQFQQRRPRRQRQGGHGQGEDPGFGLGPGFDFDPGVDLGEPPLE